MLCVVVCVVVSGTYLDDKGLVRKAGGEAQQTHVGSLVDKVLDAVEHSAPGGRHSAVDATLTDGFSRHARVGIDILPRQERGREDRPAVKSCR